MKSLLVWFQGYLLFSTVEMLFYEEGVYFVPFVSSTYIKIH